MSRSMRNSVYSLVCPNVFDGASILRDGSDCAVQLWGETPSNFRRFAAGAEHEIRRIEARYSRYRDDSELGGSTRRRSRRHDQHRCGDGGLITYAKACFMKSDGALTLAQGASHGMGLFGFVFADQLSIDVLPFIGLDNVVFSNGQLHFRQPGMELDFGGWERNTQPIGLRSLCWNSARLRLRQSRRRYPRDWPATRWPSLENRHPSSARGRASWCGDTYRMER